MNKTNKQIRTTAVYNSEHEPKRTRTVERTGIIRKRKKKGEKADRAAGIQEGEREMEG